MRLVLSPMPMLLQRKRLRFLICKCENEYAGTGASGGMMQTQSEIQGRVDRAAKYIVSAVLFGVVLLMAGCTSREIGLPYSVVPEQVTDIASGDTLVFRSGRRVELFGADAPPLDSAQGRASKAALTELLANVQSVFVDYRLPNAQGGEVGIVYTDDGRDLGFMMICKGHARWVEVTAAHEQQYKKCQTQARKNRLGVWATQP